MHHNSVIWTAGLRSIHFQFSPFRNQKSFKYHVIEQWLYLGRAQMLPPTVQQQYRRTHCPFQCYNIQSHTDKPPQCPSSCDYSTAYVSEGGQGESHSKPLRAKAVTRCMKLFSLENRQELQSISYMLVSWSCSPWNLLETQRMFKYKRCQYHHQWENNFSTSLKA